MDGNRRRGGSMNWTRGLLAVFWILLAGASGLYLFTLFTNPAALGGQAATVSAAPAPAEAPDTAATTPTVTPGQAMQPVQADRVQDADLDEIKSGLRTLSEQVSDLNMRLQPIEKFVGPVAALPRATSVTTSPPTPESLPLEPQAAAPAAVPAALPEPAPASEAAPMTPPPPDRAPARPAPTAEAAPAPAAAEPAPVVEEDPAPLAAEEPTDVETPSVTEAPEDPTPREMAEPQRTDPPSIEDVAADATAMRAEEPAPEPEPEPAPMASEPQAPPPPPVGMETAALDPVVLPPAANDGTTRYGIEIGSVVKQDGLRPLWREFLTNHAALVAGLQPRRVLAPDKKWRLIAGPFANAQEAEAACALFKKADRPCAATVYAGDSL
ncbi:MAG: SPOR domain-containing protein [Methyloceanibacter sp.]